LGERANLTITKQKIRSEEKEVVPQTTGTGQTRKKLDCPKKRGCKKMLPEKTQQRETLRISGKGTKKRKGKPLLQMSQKKLAGKNPRGFTGVGKKKKTKPQIKNNRSQRQILGRGSMKR